jgi:hypothetical protein
MVQIGEELKQLYDAHISMQWGPDWREVFRDKFKNLKRQRYSYFYKELVEISSHYEQAEVCEWLKRSDLKPCATAIRAFAGAHQIIKNGSQLRAQASRPQSSPPPYTPGKRAPNSIITNPRMSQVATTTPSWSLRASHRQIPEPINLIDLTTPQTTPQIPRQAQVAITTPFRPLEEGRCLRSTTRSLAGAATSSTESSIAFVDGLPERLWQVLGDKGEQGSLRTLAERHTVREMCEIVRGKVRRSVEQETENITQVGTDITTEIDEIASALGAEATLE